MAIFRIQGSVPGLNSFLIKVCHESLSAQKRYYLLDIAATTVAHALESNYRKPGLADHESLANLMLDAYMGTIDYDGETIDDARQEVGSYFSGRPLLDCSNLCFEQETLISACLMGIYRNARVPLVSYVMTRADNKQTGLARRLLEASISDLRKAGYQQVGAWITDGNEPSERLHRSLGFELMR